MQSQQPTEDLRVEEIHGLDKIEAIRPLWEQWQTHPNADMDFFSTVVRSRATVVKPIVIEIFDKDVPCALALCRLEHVPLPISFGYLKVARSPILQLTVIYGGLTGQWTQANATLLIKHLQGMMQQKRIVAIHFAAMKSDHPVYRAAQRHVWVLLRSVDSKDNLHWWSELPDTVDNFLKKINSKHRTQLRSKERKLSEHLGGSVRSQTFERPDEVLLFCTLADTIAQTTYLRGLGEGFYNNEEMQNRLKLGAEKGWMRGFILFVNDIPCAFWLGTLYKKIFYLDYTGFDASLKDFAPGQILFIKMVESLITAGGLTSVDFGFGDATYKQRYGDHNWLESDLYLFANTPGMLFANIIRKTAALLRTVAETTLKRFNLLSRLKKQWRNSAQKEVSAAIRKIPEKNLKRSSIMRVCRHIPSTRATIA